ncbi:MAG: MobF family relaxase [Acidimicrobiales bacterium]
MLRVAKVLDQRARYYLDDIGHELDVVAGSERNAARWRGRGSAGFGLGSPGDEPEAEMVARTLAGANPLNGRPLRNTRTTVCGFDLTFCAPKPVSLLACMGDPVSQSAAFQAHEQALDGALSYVQSRALALRRRRGAEREVVPIRGMVAVSFTHCLSRARDPHLHTHVVVANLGQDLEGRWSAIDSRGVFAHARAAGALFDAALRKAAHDSLGISWVPKGVAAWEPRGLDPAVTAAFSLRSAQIAEELARRGLCSPMAGRVAWAATRDAKEPGLNGGDLRAEWARRMHSAGQWRLDHPRRPWHEPHLDEHRFAARILGTAGSGVTRRAVVAAWADALCDGGGADEIEGAVEHWAPHRGMLGVTEPRMASRDVIASPHLLNGLGPRPAGVRGQEQWRQAAGAIDSYRSRWQVHGADPLGTAERRMTDMTPRRLTEHLEVVSKLRELAVMMGRNPVAEHRREILSLGR